jgi:hypothetical protein
MNGLATPAKDDMAMPTTSHGNNIGNNILLTQCIDCVSGFIQTYCVAGSTLSLEIMINDRE